MREKIITLYTFDDLPEATQEKVIYDEIEAILDCVLYDRMSSRMQEAVDEAERLQVPWFTGSFIWDYCRHEIVSVIRRSNCEFYRDGTLV